MAGGARLSAMVALLLLFAVSSQHAVLAQETCKEDVLGHSSIIGSKQQGAVVMDHSSLAAKGPITRVSLYYSKDKACLKAAKAAFGDPPTPGIIGSTAGTMERSLKLEAGEVITKAEYKAGKCIEYLKLSTSKGRSVSAGQVGPVSDLMTSAPTEGKGQLLAIKGSSKTIQGKKQGALQHLQLVWGSTKCTKVATQAATEALLPESGMLSAEDAAAAGPGACKPRVDMCNEKASMNAFTYCVWNAPFSGPSCRGGCCISSGKCASSSCAISGMGRDVPNMICYGVNSGIGFGGNSNCGGLACKLATPGCTTDAFGGNCVGTVVPFGSKEAVHPESRKFIGAPCLDATPSDTTLDRTGAPASGEEGLYMGKLWTVCDCAEGGTGLPEPASRLLNLTTSRISNFTKNEVLAAFSTFLPQKNVTDESNGKDKVVTLLPSFADMFKLPSLSSINLPSILGDLTGAKGGKDGQSVSGPRLPDLSGLLGQMKPAADSQPQTSAAIQGVLNPESGSLPNGTKVELMGSSSTVAAPAPAEKPPRTLGSLLSRFTKPKNDSSSSSSAAAPGSNKTDASSIKVKPMTLGDFFGGLRRAGPDNSTAAPAAAPAPAPAPAGNSTRKLDLSPIGALINKFINGPNAAPPAAPATTATTTAAPASAPTQQQQPLPATAAKIQSAPQPSQQPAPAAAPAAAAPTPPATPAPRAPGPATLTVPKSGKISYVAPTAGAPAPDLDLTPITAGHTPGDPNDRPKTLAQRLREKKAQQGATKVVDVTDSPKAAPSSDAPIPPPLVRKSGFSASVPGLNLPPVKRLQDDPVWIATGMDSPTLMLNLQALTNALQSGAGAGAEDLMQFGALLGQLQKVPGGLGALPADVSTALMTLAAEVNRVSSGGAPAPAAAAPAAPEPAAAPAAAPAADKPAATPAPAADKAADKPAAAPVSAAADKPAAAAAPVPAAQPAKQAADKPAAAPVSAAADKPAAAAAPVPAAQPAKQAADKPAAAPVSAAALAKPADADKKEQPHPQQQQQQQPVKASLASTPDSSSSSSKKETPAPAPAPAPAAAAASKEAVKQPAQTAPTAATGAAAAAPAAGMSEAPESKQDSPSQPAPAGAASKPAPAAAEDKPAAAAAASKPASVAAAAAAAAEPVKAPAGAASPSEQPKAASKQK